jgi:A/G-specific adenine glycosylase
VAFNRVRQFRFFAVESRHAKSLKTVSWFVALPCAKVVWLAKMTLEENTPDSAEGQRFQRLLLGWFDRHKRDLPWRRDRDPYRVWLSEIMLQQTRVNAVIDHYQKFLRRFPNIHKLASARESSVLAAWSGLGYYRRARMMHAAARKIVKELGGEFPRRAEDLQALPGIGRYTAAAIASIAFGEPVAVVEGNVERVLQRVKGKNLAGESMWRAAGELLDRRRPGDFNQAMMELGATLCLPRRPQCLMCPVSGLCATRGELRSLTKATRQTKRKIYYTLACRKGSIFLVQRPKNATLMPGMWELPEADGNETKSVWLTVRHSITVTDYAVRVLRGPAPSELNGRWVRNSRVTALPLTGLARKILRAAKII